MSKTTIEWTDVTWNPVTGCTKVSQGCKNCYAERVFPRAYSACFVCSHSEKAHTLPNSRCALCPDAKHPECDGYVRRQFTDVLTHSDRLEQPLRWRKPRRVFVNSMSDLFHDDVTFDFIDKVFAVMALASQHTFQVLTKRPERMWEYFTRRDKLEPRLSIIKHIEAYIDATYPSERRGFADVDIPLANVWLGVSVENQDTLHRIDTLKDVPAAVRFVSFEPLLEDLGAVIFDGVQWAIIGGESGPDARPCRVEWIRSLVRQCCEQNVVPFVKQLGSYAIWDPRYDRSLHRRLYDRKGGDPSEWPKDLRIREFPKGALCRD